jgi:hypothetical protein
MKARSKGKHESASGREGASETVQGQVEGGETLHRHVKFVAMKESRNGNRSETFVDVLFSPKATATSQFGGAPRRL